MGIREILSGKPKSKKRKYRLVRGDVARIARELRLSDVHVGLVARGIREGGSTLVLALEAAETEAKANG